MENSLKLKVKNQTTPSPPTTLTIKPTGKTIYKNFQAEIGAGGWVYSDRGKEIWVGSSKKTLARNTPSCVSGGYANGCGGTTERVLLHEATHLLVYPSGGDNSEAERWGLEFMIAANKEGLSWEVTTKTIPDLGMKKYIDSRWFVNVYGQQVLAEGNFISDYAKSNPGEGAAEFGSAYYGNKFEIKRRYPYIYQFFEKLDESKKKQFHAW